MTSISAKNSVMCLALLALLTALAAASGVFANDGSSASANTIAMLAVLALLGIAGGASAFLLLQWPYRLRQEASAALARTNAILSTVADGIITITEEGIVESFNPAAERIFGYASSEVIGRNVKMLMPEPYHSQHDLYIKHHTGTGEKRVSGRRKDGSVFPLEVAVGRFELGGRQMAIGFARDISDKKRLAAKLAGQIEAIDKVQGVVEFDMSGEIIDANDNFLAITGYRSTEILGQHHRIFMEPSAEFGDEYVRFWDKLRAGESIAGEFKCVGKNGKELWYSACYAPLFDENGRPFRVVKFATDISERKRSEIKLARYAKEVEWKNQELEAARQEAAEASRLKSDFLATMSHEIRTPMNGIIGMTELLLDSSLTSRQQDYARTVMGSAEALLAIINDILDFSKIEAGKLDLEEIPFDLHTVFDETVELLAVKARAKPIDLLLRFVPGTPTALIGDPTRIRQVVINLVGNAIKFTEKGRVLITVEEAAGAAAGGGKASLKVSVSDTGVGIPKDAQARLFQKFSQADSSTTRKFGGTGLGLAICKQLAEMMGGEIGVQSEAGAGSTFWFTMSLPRDREALTAPDAASKDVLGGLRVLIADGLAETISVVREQLESLGALCLACEDGEATVGTLLAARERGEPVHIALIDNHLLTTGGEDLIARIKAADSLVKDTALIVLAPDTGQDAPKRFAEAGVAALLSKPIHSRRLNETVFRIWEARSRGEVSRLLSGDATAAAPKKLAGARFDGARILLVEDNRVNQEFAAELLEGLGVIVTIAGNGRIALEMVRNEPFDLVLMDCEMPVMSGFEASQEIAQWKKDGALAPVPVIAQTANAMKGDKERCLAAGMDGYITKPLRKADLIECLASWLPAGLVKRPAADPVPAQQSAKSVFENARILVVEDNRINRDFAVELLQNLGCSVVTAENGKVGVEHVKNAPFDLVLMDIQMPVMDGYEATRIMRQLADDNEIARIPILALTANAMKGDRETGIACGMNDYLTKPVKKDQLVSALTKWLPAKSRGSIAAGGRNDESHRPANLVKAS